MVENLSRGRQYSVVKVVIDRGTGIVLSTSVSQFTVESVLFNFFLPLIVSEQPNVTTPLDPVAAAYLAPIRAELTRTTGEILARSEFFFAQTDSCGVLNGRACESALGNFVTDSIRAAYGGEKSA